LHAFLEHHLALIGVGVGHHEAPLVEDGLQSTTEEESARAAISPTALAWSVSRNGAARGISAPMMPPSSR
jgi:hypothetical protein